MTAKRKKNKKPKSRMTAIMVVILLILAANYINGSKGQQTVYPEENVSELLLPQFTKETESQVIDHIGYTVSYNSERRNPNWVAYELTAKELEGTESRSDDFIPDPDVTGAQATTDDYRKSGWDRGHLAPAADMKWSRQAMEESFYMSNISPQNGNLNRGVWNSIEELVRHNAGRYGSLLVVTGPLFTSKKGKGTIGEGKVQIPDAFFKVLLACDGSYKGIGFYCKNVAGKKKLQSYAMDIDGIEKLTGLDFFHNLPDSVESRVESEYSWADWKMSGKK